MNSKLPLARGMARDAGAVSLDRLPREVIDKVKTGLLDFLSCAYGARELPWGCQAIQIASRAAGVAAVIGTPIHAAATEAAFANATLGHGLVREDMHTGAVSHLGVVVFPALLALAESSREPATGRDFVTAAVCGYETGAAIGRALMDRDVVKRFRPTGVTGPLGSAIAGARLRRLNEDAATSALGFAANAIAGLNEWPV